MRSSLDICISVDNAKEDMGSDSVMSVAFKKLGLRSNPNFLNVG